MSNDNPDSKLWSPRITSNNDRLSEIFCRIGIRLSRSPRVSNQKETESPVVFNINFDNQLPIGGPHESTKEPCMLVPPGVENNLKRKVTDDPVCSQTVAPKIEKLRMSGIPCVEISSKALGPEEDVNKMESSYESYTHNLSCAKSAITETQIADAKYHPVIEREDGLIQMTSIQVSSNSGRPLGEPGDMGNEWTLPVTENRGFKTIAPITENTADEISGFNNGSEVVSQTTSTENISDVGSQIGITSDECFSNVAIASATGPKVNAMSEADVDLFALFACVSKENLIENTGEKRGKVRNRKSTDVRMGDTQRKAGAAKAMKRERTIDSSKTIGLPLSGEKRCPICCKDFETEEALQLHVKISGHYERNWMCKLCWTMFIAHRSLKVHIKRIHAKETGNHVGCKEKFDGNDDNMINLRETEWPHLEKLMPCELCNQMVKGKCMGFHLPLHKALRRRKCNNCGLWFSTSSTFFKHNREVHDRYFDCDICGKKLNTKATLKIHKIRVHEEQSKFKCDLCGMKYALVGRLRSHMVKHDAKEPEKCTLCERLFTTKPSLLQHLKACREKMHRNCPEVSNVSGTRHRGQAGKARSPSKQNPRKNVCNKSSISTKKVSKRSYLLRDMLCNYCGKVLKGRSSYDYHVASKHPAGGVGVAKLFKCDKCDKIFNLKITLDLHLERHVLQDNPKGYGDNARHKCPYCDKGFKYKGSLSYHVGTHEENKSEFSEPCTICGAKLKSKRTFRDHMNVHEGLMKYKCKKCHKVFSSQGRLHNHHISHKDAIYQCDECGSSFKIKYALKRHKREKHNS